VRALARFRGVRRIVGRYTLYAYVDGSDLHHVSEEIEVLLDAIVVGEAWTLGAPSVVNQLQERDETYRPEDLTNWDLGLNLDLPDVGSEPAGWFQDVERIARGVGRIAARTGRSFVIGIADSETSICDDLFFVEDGDPDLDQLRTIIGVEPT
jgi:hypothetical protein